MKNNDDNNNNDQVILGMRTSRQPRGFTAVLPGHLTLQQSLTEIGRSAPKDPETTRILQQIADETSVDFNFLVVGPNGSLKPASPGTRIREVALPREIRTKRGVEILPAAGVELQSYAKVGSYGDVI